MTSKLKEARENAGYTVEEVAKILKIRRQYIINLEEENFQDMPSQIYIDGYTKIYHEFLGLELPIDNDHSVVRPRDPSRESALKKNIVVFISCLMLVIVSVIYFLLKQNEVAYDNDDLTNNVVYENRSNEE